MPLTCEDSSVKIGSEAGNRSTLLTQDTTRWNQSLSVRSDGKNIIGHAGALLLRACAGRTGLTAALARVLPSSTTGGWRDRAIALITLAGAIACGATNLLEAERLAAHQAPVLGAPASDSTLWRILAALDQAAHTHIAKARARIRRHVWTRLHLRPGGFPWLNTAGEHLKGWIIVDVDATVITSASDKEGARGTFKRTYGHHPLAAWCSNTGESLTTLLRTGNAGSNTVADHLTVIGAALAQIPGQADAKLLFRIDGAGATHDLLAHLEELTTTHRTVRYTVGWTITAANIGRMHRIAGSHHPQWLDVLHRTHAVVEDRVRTNKAMGLGNLPSSSWDVNAGWVLAASLAADLDAWTRLLGCHDDEVLVRAEPVTVRHRLYHVPATPAACWCASIGPGPTRTRSPPAGTGCRPCPYPPEQCFSPRRAEERRSAGPPEGGARRGPQRHATAPPPHTGDKPGRTHDPVRQRPPLKNRGQRVLRGDRGPVAFGACDLDQDGGRGPLRKEVGARILQLPSTIKNGRKACATAWKI